MPAGYHLEPATYAGVLGALEREYRDARLSALQRRCFRWLRAASFALTLIVAAILALEVLPPALKPVSVVLQVAGTLLAPLVLVLLLVNIPLISKAVRQLRLAGRLRLLEIADAFWLRGARPRPSTGRRTVFLLAPSLALLLVFLGSLAFGPAGQRLAVTWGQTALVLAVCCGLPLALYGVERFFERLRDRLDHLEEVETLRRELERLAADAGAGPVDVSTPLAQRLADMERIHLLRRQARAVEASDRGGDEEYSVSRAPDFSRACRELPPEERGRVEETILALALDPDADARSLNEPAPSRVRTVTGTDLALHYSVSLSDRRIVLHRLSRQAGERMPDGGEE